ncbi:CLUMA_CG007875, isoform A [Clunio marinus]|uniref:CLUMA_CG007875, isoform A n=1 Tax=Clunio marinus TaxID=568069 RepID=A0A1J1I7H0_9DIPT|nr:CLUMA_CG007875, isoform A [Clunio marinus]
MVKHEKNIQLQRLNEQKSKNIILNRVECNWFVVCWFKYPTIYGYESSWCRIQMEMKKIRYS